MKLEKCTCYSSRHHGVSILASPDGGWKCGWCSVALKKLCKECSDVVDKGEVWCDRCVVADMVVRCRRCGDAVEYCICPGGAFCG